MIHQRMLRYKQQCLAQRLQQSNEQGEQVEIVKADVLDWSHKTSGSHTRPVESDAIEGSDATMLNRSYAAVLATLYARCEGP